MSNLWLGLRNAKISERGEFFGEGSFDLQINRLTSKMSDVGKGLMFIAEFTVLTSTQPKDPPMSDRVWIVKMSNQAAPGNVKGLLVSALGKDHHTDQLWIHNVFDPVCEMVMDRYVGAENALKDLFVHLETNVGKTKGRNGPITDFTYHNWSPFDYITHGVLVPQIDHLLRPAQMQPTAPVSMVQNAQGHWVQPYGQVPPPPPALQAPQGVQVTPDEQYALINGAWTPAQWSPDRRFVLVNNQWMPRA